MIQKNLLANRACIRAQLSLMHPRLLSTLILIDLMIQNFDSAPCGPSPAAMSMFRRDIWPSREAAIEDFKKNKFYKSWHPVVLVSFEEFGIRESSLQYINIRVLNNRPPARRKKPWRLLLLNIKRCSHLWGQITAQKLPLMAEKSSKEPVHKIDFRIFQRRELSPDNGKLQASPNSIAQSLESPSIIYHFCGPMFSISSVVHRIYLRLSFKTLNWRRPELGLEGGFVKGKDDVWMDHLTIAKNRWSEKLWWATTLS